MQTPLLAFQVYPAAAPFAAFSKSPVSSLEAAFSATLIDTLQSLGAPASLSPLTEGVSMSREGIRDYFANLEEAQGTSRERYALAVNAALRQMPGIRRFQSVETVRAEIEGRHPTRITAENWREQLLPDEDADYFPHMPMFSDLRSILIEIAEKMLEVMQSEGNLEARFDLVFFDDPETEVPRIRFKKEEDPEQGRGLKMVLKIKKGKKIPIHVGVGCKLCLIKADQGTPFLQELQMMINRIFWMLDNYNARQKRTLIRTPTESIRIAGREIRLGNDEGKK